MSTIKKYFTLTKRQQFFGQLFLLTLIGHILVLILCTFAYQESHERFIISSQNYNTVYVLSPLKKQMQPSSRSSGARSVKASKVIDYGTYQQLKKQDKRKSKPKKLTFKEPKQTGKALAAPIKPRKTSKALASSLAALKNNKKPEKKALLTISQIAVVKPVDSKKKVIPEVVKEIIKDEKPVDIPAVVPEQEEVVLATPKQEQADQKESVVEEQELKDVALESIDEDLDVDNVTFIGYEQLDSLAVQNKIQQVIAQNFKTPVGIKKDVSCEITVVVDTHGKSKSVTVVRSSGVMVYDTSARAMLHNIEFPKEVWNKTITIVLGQ